MLAEAFQNVCKIYQFKSKKEELKKLKFKNLERSIPSPKLSFRFLLLLVTKLNEGGVKIKYNNKIK